MPRFLLVVTLLVLVAGGGLSAWWFGVRGESLPFAGSPKEAEAASPSSEFVELTPMTFPVVRDGRVERLMTLVISLEVLGAEAGEAVRARAPVLRDAMLSELHGLYGHDFMREREKPMALVKLRLLKAGRRVIGEDLRGVYVQAVEGGREPSGDG